VVRNESSSDIAKSQRHTSSTTHLQKKVVISRDVIFDEESVWS